MVLVTCSAYPTDSNLLSDGVRGLTLTMKRIVEMAAKRVRDRMRSVGRRDGDRPDHSKKGQKQTKRKTAGQPQAIVECSGTSRGAAKRISGPAPHTSKSKAGRSRIS